MICSDPDAPTAKSSKCDELDVPSLRVERTRYCEANSVDAVISNHDPLVFALAAAATAIPLLVPVFGPDVAHVVPYQTEINGAPNS